QHGPIGSPGAPHRQRPFPDGRLGAVGLDAVDDVADLRFDVGFEKAGYGDLDRRSRGSGPVGNPEHTGGDVALGHGMPSVLRGILQRRRRGSRTARRRGAIQRTVSVAPLSVWVRVSATVATRLRGAT